jgi:hypothetical protein
VCVQARSTDFKSLPTSISRCFPVWRCLVRNPAREARLRLEMLSLDCGITVARVVTVGKWRGEQNRWIRAGGRTRFHLCRTLSRVRASGPCSSPT